MATRTLRSALAAGLCLLALAACAEPQAAAPVATPITSLAAYQGFDAGRTATLAQTDSTAKGTFDVEGYAAPIVIKRGGGKTAAEVKAKNATYSVLSSPGFVFVKTTPKEWTRLVGPDAAKLIGTKWVVSSDQGQLSKFSSFTDANLLFRTSGRIKKGPAGTINGTKVVSFIDPPSNTDSTWWFASTGEPLLQRYRAGDSTRLDFTYGDFNELPLPDQKNTVDIGTIQEQIAGQPTG